MACFSELNNLSEPSDNFNVKTRLDIVRARADNII